MSGIVQDKSATHTVFSRLGAVARRPGMGSLLILLAGFLMPLPVHQGASAHLFGVPTLCPLRAFTGMPCPGCGMTRAVCLCCHGQFMEAVTVYHPVVPLVFLGFVTAAGYGLLFGKPLPDRLVTIFAYVTVVLLIGVWVARLLHRMPIPPL